ncbi:hypothetical protein WY13_02774 [Clostridium ljungdahlii]|uniref:Uncharacterized protein n=1 Tax=Clostridium ljungdahlii TaxID=1538 RepID=A0A168MLQ6_9CLOT|nr:hypothetical protein WY13_02774 [Clostridium ljungdahlii]
MEEIKFQKIPDELIVNRNSKIGGILYAIEDENGKDNK